MSLSLGLLCSALARRAARRPVREPTSPAPGGYMSPPRNPPEARRAIGGCVNMPPPGAPRPQSQGIR